MQLGSSDHDNLNHQHTSCLGLVNPQEVCGSPRVHFMDPISTFCWVGVAKNYQLSPEYVAGGSIRVYRIILGGQGLELIHRSALDEVL
jgi:hypothetical protein